MTDALIFIFHLVMIKANHSWRQEHQHLLLPQELNTVMGSVNILMLITRVVINVGGAVKL